MNRQLISLEDARKTLKKSKAIFIIDQETDMQDIKGHIVYVSQSIDTYDELIRQFNEHKMNSERAMVIGSYENGGAVGVQYTV